MVGSPVFGPVDDSLFNCPARPGLRGMLGGPRIWARFETRQFRGKLVNDLASFRRRAGDTPGAMIIGKSHSEQPFSSPPIGVTMTARKARSTYSDCATDGAGGHSCTSAQSHSPYRIPCTTIKHPRGDHPSTTGS